MAGTHRRSTSVEKALPSPFAVPYTRSRAGSMSARDKTKSTLPKPLADMGANFINSPSTLKRSDAQQNLTNVNHGMVNSPSVVKSKRFQMVKKQASADNLLAQGHRDSPFGTPHAAPNPSMHFMHRQSAREPHPLSRSSTATASHIPETRQKPRGVQGALLAIRLQSASLQDDPHLSTPDALKGVKPLPEAFMSTGLKSKQNRPKHQLTITKPTPDTPCKRPSAVGMPHTPGTPGTPLGSKDFFVYDQDKPNQVQDHTLDDYLIYENDGDSSFIYASSSSEFDGVPHTPIRNLFTDSFGPITDQKSRKALLFGGSSSVEEENYFARSMQPVSPNVSRPSFISKTPRDCRRSSLVPASPAGTHCPAKSTGSSQATLTPNSPSPLSTMEARFAHVERLGNGEFSEVFVVDDSTTAKKFAVKRSKTPWATVKERRRREEEVLILRELGRHEHIIEIFDSWEEADHLFIQTEYCENGTLDVFLQEFGRHQRLDEFRVWKVLTELTLGVVYIHERGFMHLDLKPANVFITFDGVLKIGDFGMSVPWPASGNIEREGDREYIAPEVLAYGHYDKPVDVFSLGLIVFEAAANIVLPDNGASWQKLRSGDLSDAPRLSSSDQETSPQSVHEQIKPHRYIGQGGLDRVVSWMLTPSPSDRPTALDVLNIEEVQWVHHIRRAGAVIHEGDRGPSEGNDYDIYMVNEEAQLDTDGEDWRMEM